MPTVPSPTKYTRFPDDGYFLMLGHEKCVEKMNAIRAALIVIEKIDEQSNITANEISLLNDTLQSLKEIIQEFRQLHNHSQCVFNQKSFESSVMLYWDN
uniref:Uncharacterized protein n=1 Tax=Panagrolaimus superbus TaxID=310955 RepID=A0A914YR87_9BILA